MKKRLDFLHIKMYNIYEGTRRWWTKAQRYRWPDHQSFACEFGRSELDFNKIILLNVGFGFLHFRSPALYAVGLFC